MSVASGLPTGATTEVFDCGTVWEPLCRDNELGYMFYRNLGGVLTGNLTGDQRVGDVTLRDIRPVYLSGTEYAPGSAWIIHYDSGFGVWSFKSGNRAAWAVRTGDVGTPGGNDSDGDGVNDAVDNCSRRDNADQRDTDNDGFGNACDPDLNNDCAVNFADVSLFKAAFAPRPYDPDADFDGDGLVSFGDLARLVELFFLSPEPGPGPSGFSNGCDGN